MTTSLTLHVVVKLFSHYLEYLKWTKALLGSKVHTITKKRFRKRYFPLI